jgi:hypothetical protein
MNDLSNEPRANVVLNSLAVFVPGVSEEQREDVVLANLYAQRLARDEFSSGLQPKWFDNYRRKLSYLGWDAAPPPGVVLPGPARDTLVDEALAQIAKAGQQEHVDATRLALDALATDAKARRVFESNAKIGQKTTFLLLPCVRHSGAYIYMVLYHLELDTVRFSQRLLFMSLTRDIEIKAQRVELVRFNTRLFRDTKRGIVLSRITEANRKDMLNVEFKKPDSL